MIQFVKYQNIDFVKWDKCIEKSINGNIYAKTWYLNIVCEVWHALVLDDYIAVMPLPSYKKWGISYISQPFMCQQLGLFFNTEEVKLDEFINLIPKKFLKITYNLNSSNLKSRYCIRKNTNHIISLKKSINELRLNYSKSHIKNIKKANKHNISIAKNVDTPIEYSKNKRKISSNFMNSCQFDIELKIIKESLANGKGEIFSASADEGNCCSIFLLKDRNILYLMSSYSNKEAKRKSAYFFLLDYIFSLEKFRGYQFEFEGSNISGVAIRNKGFGAKSTYYYTIYQSFPHRLLNYICI